MACLDLIDLFHINLDTFHFLAIALCEVVLRLHWRGFMIISMFSMHFRQLYQGSKRGSC